MGPTTKPRDDVLTVKGLSKAFGGTQALADVTLSVRPGSIHALIGPNGAGKTTFINVVTGFLAPDRGKMFLGDRPLTSGAPEDRRQLGLTRTFQHCRVFPDMSCLENVMVGAYSDANRRHSLTQRQAWAHELLTWVGLDAKSDALAGNLALAEQRQLEIARAMAAPAGLVLLDEPTAGMGLDETADVQELVAEIVTRFDASVLLVAHDMELVMGVSDHITVLDFGAIIAEGTPQEVRRDRRVLDAYIGTDEDPLA